MTRSQQLGQNAESTVIFMIFYNLLRQWRVGGNIYILRSINGEKLCKDEEYLTAAKVVLEVKTGSINLN